MAKGCRTYAHLDEQWYPDHTCLTTGTEPCDVCAGVVEIPNLKMDIQHLEALLDDVQVDLAKAKDAVSLAQFAQRTSGQTALAACARAESTNDQARAEAFMDASWLIWTNVVGGSMALRVVKRCREAIEAEAQTIFPGAKADTNRNKTRRQ